MSIYYFGRYIWCFIKKTFMRINLEIYFDILGEMVKYETYNLGGSYCVHTPHPQRYLL